MGNFSEDSSKVEDGKKRVDQEVKEEFSGKKYTSDDEGSQQKYRLDYYCQLCDAHMNSSQMWENHIQGKRHKKNVAHVEAGESISKPKSSKKKTSKEPAQLLKMLDGETEPIVGLDFITELQKADSDLSYSCVLCHSTCSSSQIVSHITGAKHRLHYLKSIDKDGYELIMNMKMKKSGLTVLAEEKAAELEQEYGRGVPSVEIESEPIIPPSYSSKSRESEYTDSYSYKRPRDVDEYDHDIGYPSKKSSYERGRDLDSWASPWSSSKTESYPQITPITYPLTNLRNMSTPGKLEILEQLSNCVITTEQEAQTVTKIIKSLTQCLLQYKIRNLPPNVQDLLTKTLIGGDVHELENVLGLTSAECSNLSSILGGGMSSSAGVKMGTSGGNSFGLNQGKDMFGRGVTSGSSNNYTRERMFTGSSNISGNEARRDFPARNLGSSGSDRMASGPGWSGNQPSMGSVGRGGNMSGSSAMGGNQPRGMNMGGGRGSNMGNQGRGTDMGASSIYGGFGYGGSGLSGKSSSMGDGPQWSASGRNFGFNTMQQTSQSGIAGWGSYMGSY